jgi:hypothetical protein
MTDEKSAHVVEPTEYEIPLTDDELRELGRFTAVFSQVDYLLNEAISALTKTPWWAMSLMLESATTGPKVNMLKKILPEIRDKEAKRLASDAYDRLVKLIDKRNHVIHGMWARQLVTPQKTVKPACIFMRNKDAPVFTDELHKLADKGAKITRLLDDLLTHLAPKGAGNDVWTKPRQLHVTDRDTSELGWFLGGAELTAASYPTPGAKLRVPPQR